MSVERQNQFYYACSDGDLARVKDLSGQVDINKGNTSWYDRTGLHIACELGRKQVLQYLLTLPHIDVNRGDLFGSTPLWVACERGKNDIVGELVRDKRVNAGKYTREGATPFWRACMCGREDVAKTLMASGREIDATKKTRKGPNYWNNTSAAEILRLQGHEELAALVEKYEGNPKAVAQRLRKELDSPTTASCVFASTIFLCDGLLELSAREEPAQRFFFIAARLPLDLQHVLANRSQRLASNHVPIADRELAFSSLARALQN